MRDAGLLALIEVPLFYHDESSNGTVACALTESNILRLDQNASGDDLTLADQALLAALVLSESYHQETFSSRELNDIIEESGRPRVAHITSAISGLISRSFLTGNTKALSLSREGKAKARGLIGMIQRLAA